MLLLVFTFLSCSLSEIFFKHVFVNLNQIFIHSKRLNSALTATLLPNASKSFNSIIRQVTIQQFYQPLRFWNALIQLICLTIFIFHIILTDIIWKLFCLFKRVYFVFWAWLFMRLFLVYPYNKQGYFEVLFKIIYFFK